MRHHPSERLKIRLYGEDPELRALAIEEIRAALSANQNSIPQAASALRMSASTLRRWTEDRPEIVEGITLRPRGWPPGWKRHGKSGPHKPTDPA